MSRKIGEALIGLGLIDRDQLKQALEVQTRQGGHLGSILIELGFAYESDLGRALARMLEVRHAPPSFFESIPERVIQALPAAVVKGCRVVPIGLEDGVLHVAAIHPRSAEALRSHARCDIAVYIAPEFRILRAMERYYRIPRRDRTIERDATPAVSPASPIATAARSADATDASTQARADGEQLLADDPGAEFAYGECWRDIAERLVRDGRATWTDAGSPDDTPQPSAQPAGSVGELASRMCRAEDQQQLGSLVLDYVAGAMESCILFGLSDGIAQPFDWRGLPVPQKIESLGLPVTEDSIFAPVLHEPLYRGPVPAGLGYESLYTRLELVVPSEVLLLPIRIDGRLEGVLYGDGGRRESIRGDNDDYLKLKEKIELALSMLLLKIELRSSGLPSAPTCH